MSERQPARDRHKANGDAVMPAPAFTEAQTKALAAFVQHQLDVVVDTLGAEIGTLERFQRERLDSEMTAMRAMIEALRSEVARLRAEVAREVDSGNVTAMKGRSDAA